MPERNCPASRISPAFRSTRTTWSACTSADNISARLAYNWRSKFVRRVSRLQGFLRRSCRRRPWPAGFLGVLHAVREYHDSRSTRSTSSPAIADQDLPRIRRRRRRHLPLRRQVSRAGLLVRRSLPLWRSGRAAPAPAYLHRLPPAPADRAGTGRWRAGSAAAAAARRARLSRSFEADRQGGPSGPPYFFSGGFPDRRHALRRGLRSAAARPGRSR